MKFTIFVTSVFLQPTGGGAHPNQFYAEWHKRRGFAQGLPFAVKNPKRLGQVDGRPEIEIWRTSGC